MAIATSTGCAHPVTDIAKMSPDASPPSSSTDCAVAANAEALADRPGFRLAPEHVGLSLGEAQTLAVRSHLTLRVVGRDGHCSMVTADARQDRLNVYVVRDQIRVAAVY